MFYTVQRVTVRLMCGQAERSSEAYAAMMDAFGCIGRTGEARGLLDLAASHGLTPDTRMFNAALRCCRDQEEVKNVEQLMAAAGVKGNRATQRFLERALTRQEADYDFSRVRSSNERRDGFSRGGGGR
jgi:pentatricopeptide repeat protein